MPEKPGVVPVLESQPAAILYGSLWTKLLLLLPVVLALSVLNLCDPVNVGSLLGTLDENGEVFRG